MNVAELLIERGRLYLTVGSYAQAEMDFRQAFTHVQSKGILSTATHALLEMANLAYLEGHCRKSMELLEKAKRSLSKMGTGTMQFLYWRYKGNSYRMQGDFAAALACYRKLLKHVPAQDRYRRAIAHNLMGLAYQGAGDSVRAVRNIKLAYRLFKETKDLVAQGNCLANIGFVYTFSDRAKDALSCFKKAITLLNALQARSSIAAPLINWGTALYNLGRYDDALKKWKEALVLNTELGDSAAVAMLHNNIGYVLTDKKCYSESVHHLQVSLAIKKKLHLTGYLPSTYNGLAKAYYHMFLQSRRKKDCTTAKKYARTALAIARSYKNKYDGKVATHLLRALRKRVPKTSRA